MFVDKKLVDILVCPLQDINTADDLQAARRYVSSVS